MSDNPREDAKALPVKKAVDSGDAPGLPDPVTHELVRLAEQQSSGRIDVNVLLRVVVEKAQAPEVAIESAKAMLDIAERFEDHAIRSFQKQVAAVIEAKRTDPDEVEKRRNNRARRFLKYVVAGLAVGGVIGAIAAIASGAGVVVSGGLLCVGAVGLACLAPLASGESVSSNDVVRIIEAFKLSRAEAQKPDSAEPGKQTMSKRRRVK